MTEDPVKLYVVVMTILLCVLGFVAWSSYQEAAAYEDALQRAPKEAEELRELASEVQGLCNQLAKSKMGQQGGGARTLIENTARNFGFVFTKLDPDDGRIGRGVKGVEKRFIFDFGSGRNSPPQTRDQIARFCQAIERDSRGILKTIEIKLGRKTGENLPNPGDEDKIVADAYGGTIVFGFRTVD